MRLKERGQARVVKSWLSFENFEADMDPVVGREVLLRKSTKLPFGPSNCFWGSREDQNNLRLGRVIRYKGVRKTISQWAKELGLLRQTLHYYIQSYGVSAGIAKAVKALAARTPPVLTVTWS
jgi:hypothetical protein